MVRLTRAEKERRARLAGQPPGREPYVAPRGPQGVGTYLRGLISRYGIRSCEACIDVAAEMDRLGPDGCAFEFERLLAKLEENAQSLGWAVLIFDAGAHPIASIRLMIQSGGWSIRKMATELLREAIRLAKNDAEV